MWKIASPDITDIRAHLDTILDPEVVGLALQATEDEKDAIQELYEAYAAALGRPSEELRGNDLREELRQAVHDGYKQVQEQGRLSVLRDRLKLGAIECPYCGFGEIQDLDHHLPKAAFKPLSIFPLNLVPCCTTCNRTKPRNTSADAERQFLNSYLEDPTTAEFFVANAAIDPDSGALVVEFIIKKTDAMDDELVARLKNHVVEFDLNNRYGAQINIYLAALEVSLEDAFASRGDDGVRAFLRRSAEKSATRFGTNDWRAALLRGLAQCPAFCEGGFVEALGRTDAATAILDTAATSAA